MYYCDKQLVYYLQRSCNIFPFLIYCPCEAEEILTSIVPPNPTTAPSKTNILAQKGPSRATLRGSFINYKEKKKCAV